MKWKHIVKGWWSFNQHSASSLLQPHHSPRQVTFHHSSSLLAARAVPGLLGKRVWSQPGQFQKLNEIVLVGWNLLLMQFFHFCQRMSNVKGCCYISESCMLLKPMGFAFRICKLRCQYMSVNCLPNLRCHLVLSAVGWEKNTQRWLGDPDHEGDIHCHGIERAGARAARAKERAQCRSSHKGFFWSRILSCSLLLVKHSKV